MPALTTATAVKAYLNLTTSNQDALIASLIARESAAIEQWTGRQFPAVERQSQRLNGTGTQTLVLPDSPILSVSYLSIDGVEVPASDDGITAGYTHDEAAIYLVGGRKFPRVRQSVVCSWVAGYAGSEIAYIPAGNTPSLTPTDGGRAVTNVSVTAVATETLLTEVASNPGTGQYAFSAGNYSFSAADANLQVRMDYYCVPGPIEQACIDMVAQDIKQRDNIGVKSRSISGETVSYSSDGVSTGVQQTLKMFRKFTPC